MNAPAESLNDLLIRRASIERLLADVDAEIRTLNVEPPAVSNTCGHVFARPAVIGPHGSECSHCALKRFRADDAARECRTAYAAHLHLLPDGG